MTALGTPGAGKTIGEHPAVEIAAELAFDMGWAGSALSAIAGEFEPGGEVRLHGAIEHGTFDDDSHLHIDVAEVLAGLRRGRGAWEEDVPPAVAEKIVASRLLGFGSE